MITGEFLTRITIWIALAGYAFAAITGLLAGQRPQWQRRARWAWTIGCAAFIAHVFCAFNYYYAWSHRAAYRETARQTAEVFGLDWGGGVFVGYAFTIAWVTDVVWWWLGRESRQQRPRYLVIAWHAFFIFIIFNGTVVFETGLVRWLGLALCSALALLLWRNAAKLNLRSRENHGAAEGSDL